MNPLVLKLILATAVAVLGLLVAEHKNSKSGIWVFKPLASTGFIAIALAAGALDSSYGQIVLLALVLGWLGDIFLIPASDKIFKLGLISFFLGHVTFCVAFIVKGADYGWIAGAFVVVLISGYFISRWLVPKLPMDMRIPVSAYIMVITVMVALAAGAAGATKEWMVLIGAVLFYLSDISVAKDKFVKDEFVNKIWGLPFYYGAQVILAMTV